MSVNWSDVLVQPHAKGARSAGGAPGISTGRPPARMTTNAPQASSVDTRTGQPQRGGHSQSHGLLYSPSSPRMHTPLAAAHQALRGPHTSSHTHKPSRSASHTGEHSSAHINPEEIARDELHRKLTDSARAHAGAMSSSASADSGGATQRLKSGRLREPQAAPQQGTAAHVDSRTRSAARHAKHTPRKGKVYCGQNKLDPSLRVNGGTLEVGTRSRCFRAGFGGALHQHVDAAQDLQQFGRLARQLRGDGVGDDDGVGVGDGVGVCVGVSTTNAVSVSALAALPAASVKVIVHV